MAITSKRTRGIVTLYGPLNKHPSGLTSTFYVKVQNDKILGKLQQTNLLHVASMRFLPETTMDQRCERLNKEGRYWLSKEVGRSRQMTSSTSLTPLFLDRNIYMLSEVSRKSQ